MPNTDKSSGHGCLNYLKENPNFSLKSLSFTICDACFLLSTTSSWKVWISNLLWDTYPSDVTCCARVSPSSSGGCKNPGRNFSFFENFIHPNRRPKSNGRYNWTISSFVSKNWKYWRFMVYFLLLFPGKCRKKKWLKYKNYNPNDRTGRLGILLTSVQMDLFCAKDVKIYKIYFQLRELNFLLYQKMTSPNVFKNDS